MKDKIAIITGAGISVESGLKTFRGEDGLWEGYDIMKVASVQGWRDDPDLVLEFYNKRRAQLKEVHPNQAHKICSDLEKYFDVRVITQNVDNLHERGGSSKVLHLHGKLTSVRSTRDERIKFETTEPIKLGDLASDGAQLRPDIVWFGEAVPLMEDAARIVSTTNTIIIVGTSMQVYPAASLISYAPQEARIFYVDPTPTINYELSMLENLTVVEKGAVEGMQIVHQKLMQRS